MIPTMTVVHIGELVPTVIHAAYCCDRIERGETKQTGSTYLVDNGQHDIVDVERPDLLEALEAMTII